MRRISNKLLILFLATIFLAIFVVSGESAKPKIVVLANDVDFGLAGDLFGFLGNKGMETIRATADDFDQYKGEKFIVILGGPDAYEDVGEIVQGILSEDEQNAIREKGNRKKYVKIDPWGLKHGQRVTVLAGSDRNQTKKSHEENRGEVAETVEQEAEVEEETPAQVSVNIENFKFEPDTVTIAQGTTVVWTNKDTTSHTASALDGTFDSKTLQKDDTFNFTFNEPGAFNYQCDIHPDTMKGIIIVE